MRLLPGSSNLEWVSETCARQWRGPV